MKYTLAGNESLIKSISSRTIEVEGAFFLPYLKPEMRVLDVGCGPGSLTVGIAKRVKSVVALDIDPKSLQVAREHAKASHQTNIEFVEHTITKLPFEDSSFDAVWGHAILCHTWAKRNEIVSEIKRVLKKKRNLCISRTRSINYLSTVQNGKAICTNVQGNRP